MGQDGEEARETIATIRGEHVAMKTWYQGTSPQAEAVRVKYGPYPALWKEVINWPGWKEARKAYLKFQQTKDSGGGPVPRKRKSRWASADNSGDSGGRQRRSRWGREETPAPAPPALPGLPLPGMGSGGVLPGMPSNLTPEQQGRMRSLQTRLRTINDKLSNLAAEAARVDALPRGHRERSPSPPPIYGADGKRRNTREVRWRERYTAERHDVLEEIMGMNPQMRQGGHMLRRKRTKKIPIPVEEHPTYNFIGLIIGPRGKTQKELEAKTGCKIAIRGRGSVKEGARGRRDGKVMEGDDEPLHVVITGDDQRSLDAATDMVQQMLIVIDDEKNIHKQQQLRELALLNGTLKEDEYCQICAEKGHRSFECPRRFSMNKATVAVKCAICGDTSHPTRDCTQKPSEQKDAKQLDSDYVSFMAELDGKTVEKPPATAAGVAGASSAVSPGPPAAAGAAPSLSSSGITIIKPADKVPVTSATAMGTEMPPPPTAPGGLPPPPSSGLRPPPPAPPGNGLPPHPPAGVPTSLPPPPPPQAYVPPPQGGYNYGNQQPHGLPPPPQHAPPGQQQQQQHYQAPQQVETQGWDYRSYYGTGATGGDAGGAGGFNWWDQS